MSQKSGTAFWAGKKAPATCSTARTNAAKIHKTRIEKNTQSFRNSPQTAPNEKVCFHEKVEFALEKPSQSTIFMNNS